MKNKSEETAVDWRPELDKAAFKYHVLVAWVAVILNPVWGIEDYFNIPRHFNDFFVFRISVATATLLAIIFRNKFRHRPEIIAFIPFIGISIQNAFMYSVMTVTEVEKHTFAYIALFIGAGMFVLWKPIYSIIVVVLSFIANIIFFHLNSDLKVGEVLINGGMLTASVALFTILLINTRTNLTKKEIIARLALAKSNKELEEKNLIIEEKSKDIRDSINYAKRIQHAILPHNETLSEITADHFILYRPKDIVAGDFYWHEIKKTLNPDGSVTAELLIAAADCTGHGVPGAMVSVICSNALHRTVIEYNITEPGPVLDKVTDLVLETFGKSDNDVKDGMDVSLLHLMIQYKGNERKILTAQWAGAHNPLWYTKNGDIVEVTADKQPVGRSDHRKKFTTHNIPFDQDTVFYLFTDGYTDQFGGPHGKKFKHKPLKELLLSSLPSGFKSQQKTLETTFDKWRGSIEQIDDVCIIGLRV